MAAYNDLYLLRAVLQYDTYVGSNLTVYDRMLIHQHSRQGAKLNRTLCEKIEQIIAQIKKERWKAPETRYKEDADGLIGLEAYDPESEQWKPFKKVKK